MSSLQLTRLHVFGLAVLLSATLQVKTACAQVPEPEVNVTIVFVDIESETYERLQAYLDASAVARNCQREGLSRHELTGVFGTQEIRRMIRALVDTQRANVCWFDRASIGRGRRVDVPTGPWMISRSGSDFVAGQGSLELYCGDADQDLEAIGIRKGMYSLRSWPGGGGVPGLHSGPGPDFVMVKPGETIVIADRPADWPDHMPMVDAEHGKRLRRTVRAEPTRRLMLLEVPPRIQGVPRSVSPIALPGYAVRRNATGP